MDLGAEFGPVFSREARLSQDVVLSFIHNAA